MNIVKSLASKAVSLTRLLATLIAELFSTIFIIIDGNILDWVWLRPASTFFFILAILNFSSLANWAAFVIIAIGEILLHLALLNLKDYIIWTEQILMGYFLRLPSNM